MRAFLFPSCPSERTIRQPTPLRFQKYYLVLASYISKSLWSYARQKFCVAKIAALLFSWRTFVAPLFVGRRENRLDLISPAAFSFPGGLLLRRFSSDEERIV